MTETNLHGYIPGEYPDTELKVYGMEKHDAQVIFDIFERQSEEGGLMKCLEMAWARGHNVGAVLGAGAEHNPFVHPDQKEVASEEEVG